MSLGKIPFIPKMSFVVEETPAWYVMFCSPVSVAPSGLGQLRLSSCLMAVWTFGECGL